ncbi:hypothetical protein SLE2022_135040 [Rubroshorea leprosula]
MSLCTRVPRRELDGKDEGGDSSHTDNGNYRQLMDSLKRFVNMNAMSLEEPRQTYILISDDHEFDSQSRQDQPQQPQEEPAQQQQLQQRWRQEEPAHLLELLLTELIGVKLRNQGEKQEQVNKSDGFWGTLLRNCCNRKYKQTFRSVTELKEKEILFEGSRMSSVTDIEFRDSYCIATLKLHPILVDDSTIPKLLNLIAYEMCPDFINDYEITTHGGLLDSLIDREEDVKELRVTAVLHNGLGSDAAVAQQFNRMSNNLVPNVELQYYSDLQRCIQVHCNSAWASDLAQLCHTFFRTPWSFLVFLGALVGLVLTGLQTYKEFNENPAPTFIINFGHT